MEKRVKSEWWFSKDELRGFNWASVIGYDFKKGGNQGGYSTSALYLYTASGILHFIGAEAEELLELVKGKVKVL